MLGDFQYWVREGLGFDVRRGAERRSAGPRTVPVDAADRDC
jgi:hypothetical protein